MSYELAGEVLKKVELSSELVQKEDELRTAVADERTRIASDLHDSVTQTLFSTAAIADALPEVWDRHPEEARRGPQRFQAAHQGSPGRDADAFIGIASGLRCWRKRLASCFSSWRARRLVGRGRP